MRTRATGASRQAGESHAGSCMAGGKTHMKTRRMNSDIVMMVLMESYGIGDADEKSNM